MDPIAYSKLHPKDYQRKFVEKGVRPDMRQLLQFRDISVSTGSVSTADASALVRVGNTAALCGIKLEVTNPEHDSPDVGEIDIKVQAWPLCSPTARIGAATAAALRLGRSLTRILTTHGVLDLSQLCIVKGQSVWVLRCDVLILDDSGNLQDVALFALVAALRTLQIPSHRPQAPKSNSVGSEKKHNDIIELTDGPPTQFQVQATPLSCTFAVFEKHLILDPTSKEEDISDGMITIVRLANSRLCAVYKPGGMGLTTEQIKFCIEQSKVILTSMHSVLEENLQETRSKLGKK